MLTWAAATGIPNAVCRLGNVYGPRQSPHGEASVDSEPERVAGFESDSKR